MEPYLREIALRHLEDIVAVGQKYVAPLFVGGHEAEFAFLEGLKSFLVVALNPACLV